MAQHVLVEWLDGRKLNFEGRVVMGAAGTFIQLVRRTETGQQPGECIPLAGLRLWREEVR